MTKIGTHDGTFHCDEVLAVTMLRQLPEYRDAELVRSRDPGKLNECDILVDVGSEFDPVRHRYDHHQPSFNKTMRDLHPGLQPEVKLSSAGLVYAHFGKRVLAEVAGLKSVDAPEVAVLFRSVYSTFVSEVDAIDNGVPIAPVPPTYSIHTGLSARVAHLNPCWNRPDENETECFNKACKMVEEEFVSRVRGLADTWLPAREVVLKSLLARHSVHPCGLILRIDRPVCPWKAHFFDLEKEILGVSEEASAEARDFKGRPVFVISERNEGGEFAVTAIPRSRDDPFSLRVPLVSAWAGKRSEELSKAVGLLDCVFVHSNLFFGLHKSFDGALEMALRSLRAAGYV
ncbi:unnamed protein product [Mesocestoides corti]|nr:unnamed protein product [Mesocestoides corti]